MLYWEWDALIMIYSFLKMVVRAFKKEFTEVAIEMWFNYLMNFSVFNLALIINADQSFTYLF